MGNVDRGRGDYIHYNAQNDTIPFRRTINGFSTDMYYVRKIADPSSSGVAALSAKIQDRCDLFL